MNVIDHRQQRVRGGHVPIIPASGLPKQMFLLLASGSGQSWQPLWRMLFDILQSATRYGSFDGFEDSSHVDFHRRGEDEKMDVVRHEHVGPDKE